MYVGRDIRNAAFNHLQTLSFSYFNQNSVGYIHARVMSDTGKIGELSSWRLMDIVWNVSYLAFVLLNMLILNWKLALWVILPWSRGGGGVACFQRKLVVLNRRVREINSASPAISTRESPARRPSRPW